LAARFGCSGIARDAASGVRLLQSFDSEASRAIVGRHFFAVVNDDDLPSIPRMGLLRERRERNGRDVEFPFADEVQQQIEGAVEDVEGDTELPSLEGLGRRSA